MSLFGSAPQCEKYRDAISDASRCLRDPSPDGSRGLILHYFSGERKVGQRVTIIVGTQYYTELPSRGGGGDL